MATIEQLLYEAYSNWNDAATLARAGAELQARCRYPDAIRVLTRALELREDDADSWSELAIVHLRDSREGEGLQILRNGIAATGSLSLKALLAEFSSDKEETKRLWEELSHSDNPAVKAAHMAHQIRSVEDKEAYFKEFQSFVSEHSDNAEVAEHFLWALLSGKFRRTLGDTDIRPLGLPVARAKIAREPQRMMSHWLLLQIYKCEKDWDGVIEVTDAALREMPDEETFMQARGCAYAERGEEDLAIHWFSRAIGAKPSFAGARVDLGKLYEKQGKVSLAEQLFREIPDAKPEYGMGKIELALFLSRHDKSEEAEKIFLKAWPALPAGYKKMLQGRPDAAAFLEREAIRKALQE